MLDMIHDSVFLLTLGSIHQYPNDEPTYYRAHYEITLLKMMKYSVIYVVVTSCSKLSPMYDQYS